MSNSSTRSSLAAPETEGPPSWQTAPADASLEEVFEHDAEDGQPSARLERVLMIATMGALSCITLLNVVVRYLTNASFAFTEEVSASLMLLLVLVGSSAALVRDRHIRVMYLIRNLRPATRAALERLAATTFLLGFAVLLWYGGQQAWEDYRFEVVSPALGIPEWLFSIWLPLASALICLRSMPIVVSGRKHSGESR